MLAGGTVSRLEIHVVDTADLCDASWRRLLPRAIVGRYANDVALDLVPPRARRLPQSLLMDYNVIEQICQRDVSFRRLLDQGPSFEAVRDSGVVLERPVGLGPDAVLWELPPALHASRISRFRELGGAHGLCVALLDFHGVERVLVGDGQHSPADVMAPSRHSVADVVDVDVVAPACKLGVDVDGYVEECCSFCGDAGHLVGSCRARPCDGTWRFTLCVVVSLVMSFRESSW